MKTSLPMRVLVNDHGNESAANAGSNAEAANTPVHVGISNTFEMTGLLYSDGL